MSCTNSGTAASVCSPCGFQGTPDPAAEPLASALENFIVSFYGSVTKTLVDGEIQWTLPCNLDAGLEENPRAEGEGLACYLLRLLQEGVGDVPATRAIATQHSLTGGGDLSADRTLNLVGDVAIPGNSKYYGTNSSGTRGFHSLPASTTGASPVVFATTAPTTVDASTLAQTSLLGAVRSGESKTIGAGTIAAGSLFRFEAAGTFDTGQSNWANQVLRFKLGGLTWTFTSEDEDSYEPSGYVWRLRVDVMLATAGASVTPTVTALLEHEYPAQGDSNTVRRLRAFPGVSAGTVDTTGSNVVDLTWDNESGGEWTVTCKQAVLWKL